MPMHPILHTWVFQACLDPPKNQPPLGLGGRWSQKWGALPFFILFFLLSIHTGTLYLFEETRTVDPHKRTGSSGSIITVGGRDKALLHIQSGMTDPMGQLAFLIEMPLYLAILVACASSFCLDLSRCYSGEDYPHFFDSRQSGGCRASSGWP